MAKRSGRRADAPDLWGRFTPREQSILRLLLKGKNDQEIADALGLAHVTVRNNLVTMKRLAGVRSRLELVIKIHDEQDRPQRKRRKRS